jgi:hypothetical protein
VTEWSDIPLEKRAAAFKSVYRWVHHKHHAPPWWKKNEGYLQAKESIHRLSDLVTVLLGGYRMSNPNKKPQFKGFLEIAVSPEKLKTFLNWKWAIKDVSERLTVLLADGYKVSFSMPVNSATIRTSLTCHDVGSPNAGYCFTSDGPTWLDSLMFAMYKHFDVCQEDWLGDRPQDADSYR